MKKIILVICGIFIFVFGFLAGGYWTSLKLAGISIYGTKTPGEISDVMISENAFWESKFFGAMWEDIKNMKPVPEGEGYLTGKFIYQGKPAVGIKLKLFLNGKYRTSSIITDENGAFEVRLPVGTWYVNMIQCEGWKNKPEGNFILLSGDEGRIDEGSLQDIFFDYFQNGKEIAVSNKKPEKESIVLTINPRIKTIWPKENIQKQKATIDHSQISWEAYPGAVNYLLQIDRVTRKSKTTTTYSPILYRRVSGGNSLPLKTLPNTKGSETEEYAVTIRAYDQTGAFISESQRLSGTFLLTDEKVLFSEQN